MRNLSYLALSDTISSFLNLIRMQEARIYSGAAFDDEKGLWFISGGTGPNMNMQLSRTIEQTKDGITFEPYPAQLPKILGFHCFVSLGDGDFFLAGGVGVCENVIQLNEFCLSLSLKIVLQNNVLNWETYIYRYSEDEWVKKANYSEWGLGKEISIYILSSLSWHTLQPGQIVVLSRMLEE